MKISTILVILLCLSASAFASCTEDAGPGTDQSFPLELNKPFDKSYSATCRGKIQIPFFSVPCGRYKLRVTATNLGARAEVKIPNFTLCNGEVKPSQLFQRLFETGEEIVFPLDSEILGIRLNINKFNNDNTPTTNDFTFTLLDNPAPQFYETQEFIVGVSVAGAAALFSVLAYYLRVPCKKPETATVAKS